MRVALIQLVSEHDVAANLETITSTAREAAGGGARLLVYPEAAMFAFGAPLGGIAEPLDGPFASAVQALARELGVTIVVGMFTPADAGRVFNTLLVAGGERPVGYDKIHLFDAFGFKESDTVAPGDERVMVEVDGVPVGLTTCYDLRFPALFVGHAAAGAQVCVVSASWGAGPGKVEQWELLARARALDSTSVVLACGQGDPATLGRPVGSAPTGVGHSLVVSPFGEVLGRLGAAAGTLVVDLDLAEVDRARTTIPVLANRRPIG